MKKLKDEVIGKRIRQARMELGFSLEDVANETELSASVLDRIEKGQLELTQDHAEVLCDFLGLIVEDVLNTETRTLDSLILFRHGGNDPSNVELLDRSDEIFKELVAQHELFQREGGGKAHV